MSAPHAGPRRKFLTETDRAAWASYARTVMPMSGRVVPDPPPLPPDTTPPAPTAPSLPASSFKRPQPSEMARLLAVGDQPAGLDSSSWNKLKSGKLTPSRTLDLHGRTVQRAFHALNAFLHAAHADHVRCVEVITGRGSGEGGGAIRRELPIWLNLPALRPLVLAASYPHAANTGSVRVLLRRPR